MHSDTPRLFLEDLFPPHPKKNIYFLFTLIPFHMYIQFFLFTQCAYLSVCMSVCLYVCLSSCPNSINRLVIYFEI